MVVKNKNPKPLGSENNLIIPNFDFNYDFSVYSDLVKKDFNIIKEFFPLLNLTILPTCIAKEIYVTGKLIPYELLENCNSELEIDRNSIFILAIYPSDFDNSDIYVQDLYGKINWDEIPEEHRHFRFHKGRKIICTHHLDGEINGLSKENKSIAILFSAWKLYMQCKEYPMSKEWRLKDLKHGREAIKQLKKIGKYYGK